MEKQSVSRVSYLFAHLYLLSSYSFSSTLLSSNLSLLSASSLLCFSSLHIVGSLTSKLPSIKHHVSCIYMYLKLTYVYLCVNCVCVFHVAFTSVTSFRSLLPVVQALKSIKNTASGLVATIGRPPNPGNQGCIGHETDLKKVSYVRTSSNALVGNQMPRAYPIAVGDYYWSPWDN